VTLVDAASMASRIDQTLLSPTTGFGEGKQWVAANRDKGFASLCVSPFLASIAAEQLVGRSTKACSVVAFPLGYARSDTKAEEARRLASLGCEEIDMVLNVAALLEGENAFVHRDIEAVVSAVERESGGVGVVKVILETALLETRDIERGCHLAVEAGASFVKTSTGFSVRGASVDDVRTMRAAVGPDIGVKAAGGIRDLDTALAMLAAGATRIGTSAGDAILAEARGRETH
jgi:deoxyribose-phosphate aldolase